LKIPEVFRDLQPYLTSEDVPLPEIAHGMSPRGDLLYMTLTLLALSLFALVLGRLQVPIDRIDGMYKLPTLVESILMVIVHELTTYFCGRLENKDDINSFRAGVKECAQILSTLAQMPNKRFPPGDAKLVAQSVFAFNKSSNLRDQRASTRLSLLELMRTLMQIYKSNLVMNIGAKVFVEGIVAMAEFEKDPTCLNVLFPIYEILGKEWSLSGDTLVLIWDSFIRYYPIKIGGRAASVPSPDKLKQLLLDCFISNNSYAKFAFPRLIELLDTDQDLSANVKVSTLKSEQL
jgi:DNA repair/transcription protein MET18/MMS19